MRCRPPRAGGAVDPSGSRNGPPRAPRGAVEPDDEDARHALLEVPERAKVIRDARLVVARAPAARRGRHLGLHSPGQLQRVSARRLSLCELDGDIARTFRPLTDSEYPPENFGTAGGAPKTGSNYQDGHARARLPKSAHRCGMGSRQRFQVSGFRRGPSDGCRVERVGKT